MLLTVINLRSYVILNNWQIFKYSYAVASITSLAWFVDPEFPLLVITFKFLVSLVVHKIGVKLDQIRLR